MMFYIFNIGVILLVGLIAYWWANQGLFSSFLHLLCVIIAGALAFAAWEPITTGLLLHGNKFDNYAWGIALIIPFLVFLVIFRIALDKIAPDNVSFPIWTNYAVGFPLGVVAGTLTIGIFLIGAGHIQSGRSLFGFQGWQRSNSTGKVTQVQSAWFPAHKITSQFYSWLSVSSMGALGGTSTPMQRCNPELYKQMTLIRDSYKEGTSAMALVPDSVQVNGVYICDELRKIAVSLNFDAKAQDYGEQLTISSAQIRLIGSTHGQGSPSVVHPENWSQETTRGRGHFVFDDVSHYATSVPGRQTAQITFIFPALEHGQPKYVQIRGTRVNLSTVQKVEASYSAFAGVSGGEDTSSEFVGGGDIRSAIRIDNRLRGLNVGTNQLPGGIRHIDRYFSEGEASISKGGDRPARSLQIQGIYETPGTRIVKLDVSRTSPANIYGAVSREAGNNAQLALVDTAGREYSPIGYLHEKTDSYHIKLAPSRFVRTIDELPSLPSAGNQTLELIFRVTQNVTIAAFRMGDVTVGTCNVNVPPAL